MRRTMGTTVAAVMTVLTVAGCAQHSASPAANGSTTTTGNPAASSSTTTTGSPTASGTAATAQPRPGASCGAGGPLPARALTVTTADNGKTLCVRAGTAITVLLRGSPDEPWTAIRSSSAVLAPRTDPRMMLQRGMTGAAFEAAHAGLAAITSARHPCRILAPADPGSTTSTSPPVHCGAIEGFRVTVQVT